MLKKQLITAFSSVFTAIIIAAGVTQPAQAQEEPINIGAIYVMSGVAATYGKFASQGLELAVNEVNDAGGVLGRPLKYKVEDSQLKSDVGIQLARKLVFQNHVDVLMGLDSSGVASAVVPTIPQLRTPLIITHAATPAVTGKLCNRWTFRVSDNIIQHMTGAARIAAGTGARRWTTIGPDYAFGHQSWKYFGQFLKKDNPDVTLMDKVAFPPFGNEDYTATINRIMQANPDGVLVSLWGGDLVNFVRQARDLGFFDKNYTVMLTLGAAVEVLAALGEQMPEGIWVGTRYWFAAHDNDMNNHFVKAYVDQFGEPPSYNAEGAYAAVYAYKKAVEKAGSTDPEAVAEALSGLTFMAPTGELTIRKGNHQAVIGPTWGKTGSFDKKLGVRMLDSAKTFDGKAVTPPVSETGCSL